MFEPTSENALKICGEFVFRLIAHYQKEESEEIGLAYLNDENKSVVIRREMRDGKWFLFVQEVDLNPELYEGMGWVVISVDESVEQPYSVLKSYDEDGIAQVVQ